MVLDIDCVVPECERNFAIIAIRSIQVLSKHFNFNLNSKLFNDKSRAIQVSGGPIRYGIVKRNINIVTDSHIH